MNKKIKVFRVYPELFFKWDSWNNTIKVTKPIFNKYKIDLLVY